MAGSRPAGRPGKRAETRARVLRAGPSRDLGPFVGGSAAGAPGLGTRVRVTVPPGGRASSAPFHSQSWEGARGSACVLGPQGAACGVCWALPGAGGGPAPWAAGVDVPATAVTVAAGSARAASTPPPPMNEWAGVKSRRGGGGQKQ